ncbi:MAG: methylmalonyl Co-A mutase-associated GTPase MeaB [Candidatus Hydrogenedentota bacterium]|nr:MAG: methylmalonyl Co-A mutase-associated GTPase MeaB [Candidatus Hydrogenedentota bacterium]
MEFSSRAELARAVTEVERDTAAGRRLLEDAANVEPYIVGWTGPAGAGKSTLLSAVLKAKRRSDPQYRAAVLAVDPTSPRSGGAVLGDRIRMEDLSLDEGFFIRSVPSRLMHGGLAPGVLRLARFLAASGFPDVHIETVGVGQGEVEIAGIAETTVVVLSPHTGDDIQALKAGLFESADLLVVNKSDISGSDRALGALEAAFSERKSGWEPPRVKVSARTGENLDCLLDALRRHRRYVEECGKRARLASTRRVAEFNRLLEWELRDRLKESVLHGEISRRVSEGTLAPWDGVQRVLRGIFDGTARTEGEKK